MIMLGMLLTACQAGSESVAAPTLTLVPTFAVPTVAVMTLPVPSQPPTVTAASPTLAPIPSETAAATATQEAHANWVPYHDAVGGFTILVPPTWDHTDSGGYPAIFSARVPPGTTLGEKMMWINVIKGMSECSNPNAGGSEATSPPENVTAAGGIAFLKESGADAGAGQRYNSTSYSTLKGATCITITFILHSSNPQMYPTPPPDYDPAAESAIFDEMLGTFRFDQ
jgi:hypothetical protein